MQLAAGRMQLTTGQMQLTMGRMRTAISAGEQGTRPHYALLVRQENRAQRQRKRWSRSLKFRGPQKKRKQKHQKHKERESDQLIPKSVGIFIIIIIKSLLVFETPQHRPRRHHLLFLLLVLPQVIHLHHPLIRQLPTQRMQPCIPP
jgi:hypothetical protein